MGANLTIDSAFAEATAANSAYVIAPTCDIRAEFREVLTKYLIYRTLVRKELPDQAKLKLADYQEDLITIRAQMLDRSDFEYQHSNTDDPTYPYFP